MVNVNTHVKLGQADYPGTYYPWRQRPERELRPPLEDALLPFPNLSLELRHRLEALRGNSKLERRHFDVAMDEGEREGADYTRPTYDALSHKHERIQKDGVTRDSHCLKRPRRCNTNRFVGHGTSGTHAMYVTKSKSLDSAIEQSGTPGSAVITRTRNARNDRIARISYSDRPRCTYLCACPLDPAKGSFICLCLTNMRQPGIGRSGSVQRIPKLTDATPSQHAPSPPFSSSDRGAAQRNTQEAQW